MHIRTIVRKHFALIMHFHTHTNVDRSQRMKSIQGMINCSLNETHWAIASVRALAYYTYNVRRLYVRPSRWLGRICIRFGWNEYKRRSSSHIRCAMVFVHATIARCIRTHSVVVSRLQCTKLSISRECAHTDACCVLANNFINAIQLANTAQSYWCILLWCACPWWAHTHTARSEIRKVKYYG